MIAQQVAAQVPPNLFLLFAISLTGFVAAMCLLGLKQAERFFKPLWCGIFLYNLIGVVLWIMAVSHVSGLSADLAETLLSKAPEETGGSGLAAAYPALSLAFMLFPFAFLATVVRAPIRVAR